MIDAARDARAIATAVGVRRVLAIVCTHAHQDHINVAERHTPGNTPGSVCLHAPELGLLFCRARLVTL